MLFSGQEIGEILDDLKDADNRWLLLGLVLTFCFVAGESCIIHYMLKVCKQKVSFLSCLKYSFIGFFFSYITPSSSGGQPAQMYYMKKDGVKIGFSTLIMLLVTIAYKSVLVLLGLVLLIFNFDAVSMYGDRLGWLLALGFVLNVAFISGLAFLVARPDWARRAGITILNKLTDWKIVKEKDHGKALDKLQKALYDVVYDSPRRFMIDDDVLQKASLATMESAYRRLFADAAGARLVVVGDFDVDEILPLVRKYAGSIPMSKKASQAAYRNDGISTANREMDFKAQMSTPMVTVLQVYNVLKPYNVADEVACDALSYILDMLYTETLREDEGGTYGASSASEVSNKPDERHMMQVVFQTNVESADKLRELAKAGFRSIAENGPTADQFDKTVKNLQKTIPENRQKNAYWSSILLQNARYGYDYDKDYEAAVNALTPEKVKAAAQEFLNGNFIELVMRPE